MTTTATAPRRSFSLMPLAALLLLAGCASVTPIGELLDNSTKYNDKTVRVRK